jgi:hypothetical protein
MADPEGTGNSSARIQIIVALIGLLGVLAAALIANWNSVFPKSTAPSTPPPTATSGSRPPSPAKKVPTYSSGQLVVRGTWSCNLDEGAETNTGADFWWEQDSATKRYLTPKNGAVFFVVGMRDFDSLSYTDLERFPYSAQKIDASNATYNNLPANTVVAYRTKEGRLGKFLVVSYGVNLTIRWVTYQK